MPAKLLVTDCDGTLWPKDPVIAEDVRKTIVQLGKAGIIFMAATARRPSGLRIVYNDNEMLELAGEGLPLPVATLNGAKGFDMVTGEEFFSARFPRNTATQALELLHRFNPRPVVYVDHPELDVISAKRTSSHPDYIRRVGSALTYIEPREVVTCAGVLQMSLIGMPLAPLRQAAAGLRSLGLECHIVPEHLHGGHSLLITAPGISKPRAVDAFCQLHGIGRHEVVAIGDGDNDVDLLNYAGYSYAMNNASPAAIEAANEQIDPIRGWVQVADRIGVDVTPLIEQPVEGPEL